MVAREINAVFNEQLVVKDVNRSSELAFILYTVGNCSETPGRFDVTYVGYARLPVGEDFEGFIALETCWPVPNNGPPVLELSVRFEGTVLVLGSRVRENTPPPPTPPPPTLPPPLIDVIPLGPSPSPNRRQAPRLSPRVAAQVQQEARSEVPALQQEAPSEDPAIRALVRSEVPAMPAPELPVGSEVPAIPATELPVLVPASSASEAAPSVCGSAMSVSSQTSSIFHIDEAVFQMCRPNMVLEHLFSMQKAGGSPAPFPVSALRNYNVIGCGFDRENNEHQGIWPGVEDGNVPEGIDDVLEQLGKIGREQPHWCCGVLAIISFLTHVKVSLQSSVACVVLVLLAQATACVCLCGHV